MTFLASDPGSRLDSRPGRHPWKVGRMRTSAAAQGRLKTKTYKQTKEYIRPLTRLCKRKGLEPSIKGSLLEMIAHCDAGEFVKANDAYILVAIGNAAWPIGVTSVGIHTRTAREKGGTEERGPRHERRGPAEVFDVVQAADEVRTR